MDAPVCVAGQVVHIRRRGATLVFADVLETGTQRRVELVIKGWERVPKAIKVGDEVAATGHWDAATHGESLRVTELPVVTRKWDARAAAFVPQPPASRVALPAVGHCRTWLNQRRCLKEHCRYRHVDVHGAEFAEAVRVFQAELFHKRSAAVLDANDPHGGHKARKSKRAQLFADWLVEHYALGAHSVVLDVAGGAGRLAAALLERGVGRVIVVDPRPPRPSVPPHPAGHSHDAVPFDADYVCALPVTLVAALHPDEATDAALLWARRHSVHFAIVPCCVFGDRFPHRRWRGEPVTTFDQLVGYLVAQCADGECDKAFLPMQGRNLVIHSCLRR